MKQTNRVKLIAKYRGNLVKITKKHCLHVLYCQVTNYNATQTYIQSTNTQTTSSCRQTHRKANESSYTHISMVAKFAQVLISPPMVGIQTRPCRQTARWTCTDVDSLINGTGSNVPSVDSQPPWMARTRQDKTRQDKTRQDPDPDLFYCQNCCISCLFVLRCL